MGRIGYLLSNEVQPDLRLEEAMLFAALDTQLRDAINPIYIMYLRSGDGILWGRDPFGVLPSRDTRARDAFEHPAVLDALEGHIVGRADVQSEMDRLSAKGYGASLRNLRRPLSYIRHCSPGDSFEQHESAIRSLGQDDLILVSPNWNLRFVRRYLVVAGVVAAETPYRYCTESPTELLSPDAWKLQAEDFMSPLSEEDPTWLDMQRAEADRLLSDFPLLSGAIDIGLDITADGWATPKVESVISAPPGAFLCFHADPHLYASAISRNLELLEPSLRETEGLNL